MQEFNILQKFKNKNNYNNPHNPVVLGILYSDESITCILHQLSDMLRDNFSKTTSILGEELTNIVLTESIKAA